MRVALASISISDRASRCRLRPFLKNLQNDVNRYVQTSSCSAPTPSMDGTFPSFAGKAIHMYRLAMGTPYGHRRGLGATRQRLEHLGAKASTPTNLIRIDRSGEELSQLRSINSNV